MMDSGQETHALHCYAIVNKQHSKQGDGKEKELIAFWAPQSERKELGPRGQPGGVACRWRMRECWGFSHSQGSCFWTIFRWWDWQRLSNEKETCKEAPVRIRNGFWPFGAFLVLPISLPLYAILFLCPFPPLSRLACYPVDPHFKLLYLLNQMYT